MHDQFHLRVHHRINTRHVHGVQHIASVGIWSSFIIVRLARDSGWRGYCCCGIDVVQCPRQDEEATKSHFNFHWANKSKSIPKFVSARTSLPSLDRWVLKQKTDVSHLDSEMRGCQVHRPFPFAPFHCPTNGQYRRQWKLSVALWVYFWICHFLWLRLAHKIDIKQRCCLVIACTCHKSHVHNHYKGQKV